MGVLTSVRYCIIFAFLSLYNALSLYSPLVSHLNLKCLVSPVEIMCNLPTGISVYILILNDFTQEQSPLKGFEFCDIERRSLSFSLASLLSLLLIKMRLYVPERTLSATFVISIDAVL